MSEARDLSRRDLERLSSYIDGELSPKQAERLEARLDSEPALRRGLTEMRWTVSQLRGLPPVRIRRNFTLTPEMAGIRERRRAYPVLRLATALAMMAFFVTVGLDVLLPGPMGAAGLRTGSEPAAVEMVEELGALDEAEEGEVEAEAPMAMEAPAEPPTAESDRLEERGSAEPLGTPAPMEAAPEQGEMMAESTSVPGDEATPTGEATSSPDGVGGAGEELGDLAQQEISGTSTAEAERLGTPPTPEALPGEDLAPGGPWPPLVRFVEIGLGLLALILLGLTLGARRSVP